MPSDSSELVPVNKTDFNQNNASDSKGKKTEDNDTLTDIQGFMLLLPSYIGMGFLGLPYMVKLLGLWNGSIGLLLYGFLNELGALILAGNTASLTERTGEKFSDIGRVAEMSMKFGPPCLQPHAGKFRFSVDFCIFMSYGLFLPDLISAMNLFVKDFLHEYIDINDTLSIVGISVLLLPVYLTRRMKLLSHLATAGSITLFGIIIISFQYICQDLPDTKTRPAAKLVNFLTVTSFANDVMFSYDGIALVLPVRARIKSTKHFDGWNGMLGLSLMFVTSFHVACGFFGYLKFGEMTQVNFILNLPSDLWIYKSLKILSFLTLYLAIGTTAFVVIELVWGNIKHRFSMEIIQNNGEYVCRIILLILSGAFAVLVPELQLLLSLTGCFAPVYVTLVVPCIIKLLVMYDDEEQASLSDRLKRKLTQICTVAVIIFGIISVIAGTGVAVYTTMYNIIL